MRAFIKLCRGLLKMPYPWQIWLALGVTLNLATPLFYLSRPEARIIVATTLAAFVLMSVLTSISGFTRLLGLGHFFWFPLLYFLWTRLDRIPPGDFFGFWVRALMVYNAISLVIDVTDVIRYIAGDREETVQGL